MRTVMQRSALPSCAAAVRSHADPKVAFLDAVLGSPHSGATAVAPIGNVLAAVGVALVLVTYGVNIATPVYQAYQQPGDDDGDKEDAKESGDDNNKAADDDDDEGNETNGATKKDDA
jgi:hypothetical protein